MEVLTFVILYISCLLLFVFVMLFGEQEFFRGTPVAKAHWLITAGAFEGLEWAAGRLCGERGRAALGGCEAGCCERSNPLVQILFLTLLGGTYYLFWRDVFPLLPLPGLPAWHKWTGSAAAAATLALFAAASLADPGIVTPANAEAHCRLYPPDGVLFEAGAQCWSCNVPKPSRSKHCKACGRCVARFDHHCVWTNNCIGLMNMRWFLAFCLATSASCAYGAVVAVLVIRGDMADRGAWDLAFHDAATRRLVFVGDSWRSAAHYISVAYTAQAALVFFLCIAGWIVFGFACYQVFRICQGVTTNESFKRKEYVRAVRLQREFDAQRAQQDAITERILAGGGPGMTNGDGSAPGAISEQAGTSASPQGPGSSSRHDGSSGSMNSRVAAAEAAAAKARAALEAPVWEPPNIYDRGPWRNLSEVLFPWHHLREAARWRKDD